MPGNPYAVLKYWLVDGPTREAKGDRKTCNEILFTLGAFDISIYLKVSSVHAILSSSGAMVASEVVSGEFFFLLSIHGVTAPAS